MSLVKLKNVVVLSHMPQQEKCYLLFEKKSEESIFTLCSLKIKNFKTRQNAYDKLTISSPDSALIKLLP